MREYIRYEIRKQKNIKFIGIIGAAVFIFYIAMGMIGAMPRYCDWVAKAFLTDSEYREAEKNVLSGTVDEAYAASWEKQYKSYIDAHRLDDEEILKKAKKYLTKKERKGLTVPEMLYDIRYNNCVVSDEDFNSMEMSVLEEEYMMILCAKEPLAIFDSMDAYAPALAKDYQKCIEKNIRNIELVAGYHYGWDVMISINSQLPYTLAIVLALLFCALFAAERETGMRPLLRISRHGRKAVVTAKLLYACGASAILYLVFQIAALAATAAVYGLEGADCTVYGPLYLCPYGFTYGQYYLLQCAVGLFGTFAFTLLMGALSSLLKSRVSLMAGLGLILATASPFADFFNVEPAFQTLDKIKALMPTQIMGAFNTFQIYQGYEVGGHVIRLPLMTALAAAGWIALCLAVIYRREG